MALAEPVENRGQFQGLAFNPFERLSARDDAFLAESRAQVAGETFSL